MNERKKLLKLVQLLKDFKFKRELLIFTELINLTVIASLNSDALLTICPYSMILAITVLICGLSGKKARMSTFSKYMTPLLMAFLVTDISAQYLMKVGAFKSSALINMIGL